MENTEDEKICKLEYNTGMKRMALPEYGRSVEKMVEHIKSIEDKAKRTEQARAVVKVMELLNPQVHLQDDYEHKLWDHLFIIADYDLDIDAPYPMPSPANLLTKPEPIPMNTTPIKANHYGRNVESIIELIVKQEEGEVKDYMIRSLASYMRQQYLIWNKDTVSDETIFADLVKLSDGRISIPEGMQLTRVNPDASFPRPGAQQGQSKSRHNNKQFYRKQQRKK